MLLGALNTLKNTEQALKLRFTGKLGGGKYVIHTNKSYWGIGAGGSYNNESFTNGTSDDQAWKDTSARKLIFLILAILACSVIFMCIEFYRIRQMACGF